MLHPVRCFCDVLNLCSKWSPFPRGSLKRGDGMLGTNPASEPVATVVKATRGAACAAASLVLHKPLSSKS